MTDFHVSVAGSAMTRHRRTDERLAAAVAHVAALDPAPDAILCTGDLVDEGSDAEYARLRELLSPLTRPVYVVPGNHDEREALRRAFADRGYFPASGRLDYVVDVGPIRVVAVDTNVPGSSGGRLGADGLAWLAATLDEARDRPTVIMQHHPPMTTGMARMDEMGLEDAEAEAAVIARHPHVERILCGHFHRPIAARVGGTLASTCPSTAHQVELDLRRAGRLAVVNEPPAVQLHVWAGGRLVSHTSYVGDHGAPEVLVGE